MSAIFDNEKFKQFQQDVDNITIQFLKYKQAQSSLEETCSIFDTFFTVERQSQVDEYYLMLDKMLESNKIEPKFSNVLLTMQLQECLSIYRDAKSIHDSYKKTDHSIIPENCLPAFMPTCKNYSFK